MSADNNETVVMEGIAGYGMNGRLGKLGKFCITKDTLYINKVSQVLTMICVVVCVAAAIVVVNATLGLTSKDYTSAALKGSLTGLGGAVLGFLVSKIFPKKVGEIEFASPLSNITSVTDKNVGVRPVLEIAFKDGTAITAALPNRDSWKNALNNRERVGK